MLRSPILVVGLLDRSPTPERLAATIDRAGTLLPRLRQRIEPPLWSGRPRWCDDGHPSLAHHVRRVRAPGGDLEVMLAVAEPEAAAAFDPARPPWTLTVVDGLERGRSAVALCFHHAITDGVGGVEVAAGIERSLAQLGVAAAEPRQSTLGSMPLAAPTPA